MRYTKPTLALLALAAVVGAQAGPDVPRPNDRNRLPVKGTAEPTIPSPVIPTENVLVFLQPGVDAAAFGLEYGVRYVRTLKSDNDAHVFQTASIAQAQQVAARASQDKKVRQAITDDIILPTKYAFTPNDPYYPPVTESGLNFPGQWHLNNTGGFAHVNVVPAWNRNTTGSGVVVGVIDDSVEIGHPDISPNNIASLNWDFGDNDSNPSPVTANDKHGTSVAGVAAARGGNSIGVTGAAPFAFIAGIRNDFNDGQPASQWIDSVLWRSSGAVSNRRIHIKNHSYGIAAYFIPSTGETAALTTSAMAGTIHVLAAGNESSDANAKMFQGNPWGIVVAALASDNTWSSYSNYGANVFVTAPSNSFTGGHIGGITTTDDTGAAGYNTSGNAGSNLNNLDYTWDFGGTSSASPLVSGVLALAKQVNMNADGRYMKHLLARTSDVVHASDNSATSDGGWRANAAGFQFNQNYGFGRIDADELTQKADDWWGSTPLVTWSTGTRNVGATIPDGNTTGISRTFSTTQSFPLEEVVLSIDTTHTYVGDLEVFLISPTGFTQRGIRASNTSSDNLVWSFTFNGFWGTNPAGTWTVIVRDVFTQDEGTWNNYSVTLRMGGLSSRLGSNLAVFNPTTRALGNYSLLSNRIFAWTGLPTIGTGWVPVAMHDINRDHLSDVLQWNPTTRQVGYWRMNRNLIAGWQSLGTLAANWAPIGIADIDKNGHNDIMLYNSSTRSLAFWLCTNGVVTGWRTVMTLAAGRVVKGAVDVDKDGDVDILVDIPGSRIYGAFIMNGPTIVTWKTFSSYSPGWALIGAGDFNNDGWGEGILANSTTRQFGGWAFNNTVKGAWSTIGLYPAGWNPIGVFPF